MREEVAVGWLNWNSIVTLCARLQSLSPTLNWGQTHGLILGKPSTLKQVLILFELLDSRVPHPDSTDARETVKHSL